MPKAHPKRQFLEEAGALHRSPGRVRAAVFERHRFFDPLDKVQVKYEMLRAHAVEGRSVVTDVYERERSNGGKLEFYITETEWTDAASGDPVCKTIFTMVVNVRPPS